MPASGPGGPGTPPRPLRDPMPTIGLALSGGGFRATLYHLGVVRYLRDAGLLPLVTDIASVSGGSILAAHLVLNWDRYTADAASFDAVAGEVVRFVQHDIRNRIVRRLPLLFPLRTVARAGGLSAAPLSPNALLERAYREFLYGDRRLFELPARPGLHILATNVADGVLAVFNRDGLHVQKRDLDGADPFRHVPGATAAVAKVVAASSAFPGFFPPVEISAADLGVREGQFPTESFTDGGVYDNLGIRAIRWLQEHGGSPVERVFVSDAGKPFQIIDDASLGFVAQSIRATDILWDRVWQLERENFGDRNGFHFVPVAARVDRAEDPHAIHPLLQAEIASIRTDLDRFDDVEVDALAGHGYEMMRSVHRRVGDVGLPPVHEGPLWLPRPGGEALLAAEDEAAPGGRGTARQGGTHPTARMAAQLRRSGRRKVWSTLFDPRDWPSWLYLVLGLVAFVWLPMKVWSVHRRARMLAGVIDSIAKGDPDIRLVLDLVEKDPLSGWSRLPIETVDDLPPARITGVDVLARSRIVDLREAWVGVGSREGTGRVRIRDRLTVRVREDAKDPAVTLHTTNVVADLEYRQPPGQPQIVGRRGTVEVDGERVERFALSCDFSREQRGVPISIEVAIALRYPRMRPGRMPFHLDHPADLITVWMLFPEDHPYRSYRLLRHPAGNAGTEEPLEARYTIDHPYGTLIGWSVIMPEPGTVYECRWTGD